MFHLIPGEGEALSVLVVQCGLLESDPDVNIHRPGLAQLLQDVQANRDRRVGDHVEEPLGELNVAVLDRGLIRVAGIKPQLPLVGDGLVL